ncbi:hypothetical protein MWU49_11405 [Alcanivorax sp. S6407]|uniref:hypothetical protein n=1 Tax=Alcanivorax sp. S6407 TaxID=2926424 RepID=UPI001FF3835E|nr:hypothetical protein [Alcanivorax sp. S6407]MCK0154311.1 hypothetical protein [Alcanivorax sp. S6407]
MKKVILTGLTAVMMSSAAMASEVVEGTDTTVFTADSPAVASEVNGNFAALIAAINDNSQRLDALEAVVGDGTVAGTYTFIEMAVELAANSGTTQPEGYSEISTYKSTGSFTLDAQGGFSGTINENRSSLVDNLQGVCDDGAFGCRFAFDPQFNISAPADGLSGTWSDDGSTVTLTLGPDDTVVLHKAGPKLLVFNGRDTVTTEGEPIYDFTNLVFLIKQ